MDSTIKKQKIDDEPYYDFRNILIKDLFTLIFPTQNHYLPCRLLSRGIKELIDRIIKDKLDRAAIRFIEENTTSQEWGAFDSNVTLSFARLNGEKISDTDFIREKKTSRGKSKYPSFLLEFNTIYERAHLLDSLFCEGKVMTVDHVHHRKSQAPCYIPYYNRREGFLRGIEFCGNDFHRDDLYEITRDPEEFFVKLQAMFPGLISKEFKVNWGLIPEGGLSNQGLILCDPITNEFQFVVPARFYFYRTPNAIIGQSTVNMVETTGEPFPVTTIDKRKTTSNVHILVHENMQGFLSVSYLTSLNSINSDYVRLFITFS